MANVLPEDLLELLVHADEALKQSDEAVLFAAIKEQELDEALDEAEEAKDVAFEAMEEATAAAAIAIDAVKSHFGL